MLELSVNVRSNFWFIAGLLCVLGQQKRKDFLTLNFTREVSHAPWSSISNIKPCTPSMDGGFKPSGFSAGLREPNGRR